MGTLLVAFVASWASCTTYIQPVQCQGGPYRCIEGSRDVKFCENEVAAVEGKDCADLGLAPQKRFCFVANASCVETNYEVKGRDCKVLQYRSLREGRECPAGTPTFIVPYSRWRDAAWNRVRDVDACSELRRATAAAARPQSPERLRGRRERYR